ncbi:Fanconi anemia core complex-associated protein 24 isoform X1 [Puntigrus tetrazona]|uniref:Fanconi anemia core complex-associated protein 24 isoform X1 n=1 Tax=Puntigrus tetrazona TaxID=1606681 RepID=UPI001C8998A4|nr:Fanconi anemia core complex-associated protein 24 isoform X1 [Puntigrus tetrazona]
MRVRHARIRRFYNVPQRSYVLSERASASVVLNARASVVMESKPVPAKLLYAAPPYGQMISHEKWRGSSLLQSIRGSVTTIFEEELGVVDFCLSNKTCILYVSESDLVAGNGYRRKIVQFRNANSGLQGIVIVEKTHLSEQYFSGLQKFVVLELGLTLLPVSSAAEAAQLIAQLVLGENKDNPFVRKSVTRLLDPVVLSLVLQIPGVGKVKATQLLQRFPSIHQLCGAPLRELEPIVGQATAQHIATFFHSRFTI